MAQNINWGDIVAVIVSLLGGGVIGVIVKAFTEKGKLNAEATNTNIKSLLEIDQRMNERMAKLEERVANLEQENYKLKSEKLNLEKETHKLKITINELKEENKRLESENHMLRGEITALKQQINIKNIRKENNNG